MESIGQDWRTEGAIGAVYGETIWHHESEPTQYRMLDGMALYTPYSVMRIAQGDDALTVEKTYRQTGDLVDGSEAPWTHGDAASDVLAWIHRFMDYIPYSLGFELHELVDDLRAGSQS
jgi:hypothetical protein